MVERTNGCRWTVVFDAGRFSEFFDGSGMTERDAVSAALRQARIVRAARHAELAPYFTIKVGTGPGDMRGLTMPMTDLDLDDDALIDQIVAGAALELAREQALNDAMEAAKDRGPTRSATASSSVLDEMNRVRRVIDAFDMARGSRTVNAHAIAAARLSDNHEWPDELAEFFTVDKPSGRVTPYGALYEVDEMITARGQLMETRVEMQKMLGYPEPAHLTEWSREPAGSPVDAFLDAFVPIAGDDKEFMIVDLRDGDLHGSVSVYQREGDISGPGWISISAMLADLADSFETGVAFESIWIPTFSDMLLSWDAP